MGVITIAVNALGAVLLAHAVYSAYEHSQLRTSTTLEGPQMSSSSAHDLPLDITLETLFSVALLSLGLVFSSPQLKPIQWRTWAGETEREKSREPRSLDEPTMNNPYIGLEERLGFLDVRQRRKDFAAWKQSGGKAVEK